jgi:copper transport protein
MKKSLIRVLAITLMVALPASAFAHAHLESAQPVDGSIVAASPSEVRLMFSESVALLSLTLKKEGGGAARQLGPLPRDAARYQSVPLPRLTEGVYTLRYRAVSDDTHEAKGRLRFTVSAAGKPN